MISQIKLVTATISDLNPIRNLMLYALKNDPNAFSVDYEEYQYNSTEWWDSYLFPFLYQSYSKLILAKSFNKIVGMIGIIYERKKRKQHACSIVWFYVDPDYRNQGVGSMLIQEAIKEIKLNKNIIKISLMMNEPQKSALGIYQKFGFKIAGTLEKELKINNEYVNEYILEKFLDEQDDRR